MRIERDTPPPAPFIPIVLVLETEAEAFLLTRLFGGLNPGVTRKVLKSGGYTFKNDDVIDYTEEIYRVLNDVYGLKLQDVALEISAQEW